MKDSAVRPDTAHSLLARAARAQAEGRAPSLVVGVVRDGTLVWSAGRGSVDVAGGPAPTNDTQYRIGSITKGFTAVQVMQLRDGGRLDLEDRLDKHVSGTAFGDRTIRQLLSHTAGLRAEPPGPWWERSAGRPWDELVEALGPDLVVNPPGRRFHYSNPGYALLGQLVAELRGRSWYDALRADVLDPLELRRTTYDATPPHARGFAVHPWSDLTLAEPAQDLAGMAAAGQLWSTIDDLAVWACFVAGDTGDVLASDTLAEMLAVQVIDDGPEWTSAYGLGMQVFRLGGRSLVGHGGSVPGFLAMLVVDPERRTGSVELANATSGAALTGHELLEILERHEPSIPAEWRPVDRLPDGVLELLGVWFWGPTSYTLRTFPDGGLELSPIAGRGRGSRFRPVGDGRWVGLGGYFTDEILTAVRRPDGSVSHLDIGMFVFTRGPYEPSDPIPGGITVDPWNDPPGPA